MRKISKFDKLLIGLMILLVVAIFTLATVISSKGGSCVVDPCKFLEKNNESGTCVIYVDNEGKQAFNLDISSLSSENKPLNSTFP